MKRTAAMPALMMIVLAAGAFPACSSPDLEPRTASLETSPEAGDFTSLPRLVEEEHEPGRDHVTAGEKLKEFPKTLLRVKKKQKALSTLWSQASSEDAKDKVRTAARKFLARTIVDDILPAWKGTPWTMYAVKDGLKPDALMPNEKGKGTSCSYFVASVLTNAGLKLESRAAFAKVIAVRIQKSLAPEPRDLHRYHKVSPEKLEQKLLSLGPGLYLVGLNCHIGFITVGDKKVRFVHASYLEPYRVVEEALTKSQAIEKSFKSGYVVTPLFQDDRLVEFWLEGRPVPLQD